MGLFQRKPATNGKHMSAGPFAKLEVNLDRGCQVAMADEASALESRQENEAMASESVIDRYRCPEGLLDIFSNGRLSSDAGFFRFGHNSVCYGRSRSGTLAPRPGSRLHDAINDITLEHAKLGLPFDLNEIIDNLRLERYANDGAMESGFIKFCKKIYYHVRPLTNQTIRKQVQKFHARNWKKRSFPQWPIDTSVESVFETVLLLSMKAKGLEKIPFVWFWPNGASSCLTMTHDVETNAGRDFCPTLMDVDDAFGIKAVFGIVPEERYKVSPDLLESIQSRGFEVAVQQIRGDFV